MFSSNDVNRICIFFSVWMKVLFKTLNNLPIIGLNSAILKKRENHGSLIIIRRLRSEQRILSLKLISPWIFISFFITGTLTAVKQKPRRNTPNLICVKFFCNNSPLNIEINGSYLNYGLFREVPTDSSNSSIMADDQQSNKLKTPCFLIPMCTRSPRDSCARSMSDSSPHFDMGTRGQSKIFKRSFFSLNCKSFPQNCFSN